MFVYIDVNTDANPLMLEYNDQLALDSNFILIIHYTCIAICILICQHLHQDLSTCNMISDQSRSDDKHDESKTLKPEH